MAQEGVVRLVLGWHEEKLTAFPELVRIWHSTQPGGQTPGPKATYRTRGSDGLVGPQRGDS